MFGPPSANPGDILFQKKKKKATLRHAQIPKKYTETKRFWIGEAEKEPPYLAAELGADPAGSPIPLGPVSDGSCGGGRGRGQQWCDSHPLETPGTAPVSRRLEEKKNPSGRLPELRLSPQPRAAPRVHARTRPRVSLRHVRGTEVSCFVSCRASSASR